MAGAMAEASNRGTLGTPSTQRSWPRSRCGVPRIFPAPPQRRAPCAKGPQDRRPYPRTSRPNDLRPGR
eukprot:4482930-Prymnesium_polylepis.1